MNIEIEKGTTLKVNNSDINVKIKISLNNVKEDEFNKKYNILSMLGDACLANEYMNMIDEIGTASQNPIAYGKLLKNSEKKIKNTIKVLSNHLSN